MAETQPTPRPPLLNLDTLTERPIVSIDGVPYEMRSPDEISVLEFSRLGKLGRRMDAIEALEESSDEQQQEYERLLDRVCRAVLLAPDDVHQRLRPQQRAAVVMTFTRLRLMTSFRPAGAKTEATEGARDEQTPETAPPPETTGAN